MSADAKHPALTMWSEDEVAFRDAVRSFAEAEIKPHVNEMDEKAQMKPEIIGKLFEMGLMGIESPERFGGAGSSMTRRWWWANRRSCASSGTARPSPWIAPSCTPNVARQPSPAESCSPAGSPTRSAGWCPRLPIATRWSGFASW